MKLFLGISDRGDGSWCICSYVQTGGEGRLARLAMESPGMPDILKEDMLAE